MTWSEENHTQRVSAERRRLRLARKGVRLEERGNSDVFPIVAIAGAAFLTFLYRQEGHRVDPQVLESIPWVGAWLAKYVKGWKRNGHRNNSLQAALARQKSASSSSKGAGQSVSTSQKTPQPASTRNTEKKDAGQKADKPTKPQQSQPQGKPMAIANPVASSQPPVVNMEAVISQSQKQPTKDPPAAPSPPQASPPTPSSQPQLSHQVDPCDSQPAPTLAVEPQAGQARAAPGTPGSAAPTAPSTPAAVTTISAASPIKQPQTPEASGPDASENNEESASGAKRAPPARRQSFTGTPKSKFINVVFPRDGAYRGPTSLTSSRSLSPPSPPSDLARPAADTLRGAAEALKAESQQQQHSQLSEAKPVGILEGLPENIPDQHSFSKDDRGRAPIDGSVSGLSQVAKPNQDKGNAASDGDAQEEDGEPEAEEESGLPDGQAASSGPVSTGKAKKKRSRGPKNRKK
eukprot:jgi/Botrbrau1/13431/Bobra.0082s0035.1